MINEHDIKDFWSNAQTVIGAGRGRETVLLDGTFRPTKANEVQHGGTHYKKYGDMQPWDVIVAWNLDYLAGTALKYIARWEDKGGIEDLRKAIHFLEKKIEVEEEKRRGLHRTA